MDFEWWLGARNIEWRCTLVGGIQETKHFLLARNQETHHYFCKKHEDLHSLNRNSRHTWVHLRFLIGYKRVFVFFLSVSDRVQNMFMCFFLMGAQQYFCFYDREVLVCFCDRCRNVIETCLSFLAKCKRCCWKMCVFIIGCRKVRAFLINWKMLLYVVGLGCNTWPPTKTSWGWGGMLCGGTSTAPPNKQKLGKERWSTCVFARMILFIAEPPKNLAIIYLICPDNFVPMGPLALLSSFSTFKICMPVWG